MLDNQSQKDNRVADLTLYSNFNENDYTIIINDVSFDKFDHGKPKITQEYHHLLYKTTNEDV